MNKFYIALWVMVFPFIASAQQATIKGKIINGKTKETLPGVNVTESPTHGVQSDDDGNYSIKVNPGKVKLTYSFMGFRTIYRNFEINPGDIITENVMMYEESMEIEGVVVSAGKFEQKISDVTVSMAVLKPDRIESQNTNDASEALRKIPGLDIYDGQPSIRGGSGYSYGAGSRVLLLVDDLPLLTPDAGDAKWDFIPIENIAQIEVLKGASSALFGSSALNGVINVRTKFPTDKPLTKFSVNNGIYMNPKRKELIWWDGRRPGFAGMSFLHSRKINQFDLVVGANGYIDHSFRESEGEAHARLNVNFRYRDKKIEGLSYGFNTNFMYAEKSDFFLWQNDSSGAWRQNPDAISANSGIRFNFDPYLLYFSKKEEKHSLRLRYFMAPSYFRNAPEKNNESFMTFGEYQFHKKLGKVTDITTGISAMYGESSASLMGNHFIVNGSYYLQFDFRFWKKLGVSLGGRLEYYRIDTAETESSYALMFTKDTFNLPVWPVFRVGLNYQLFKYTFLRASFGQGYRFPTIAEKFISTSIGGLNLFPNPRLKPETGWTAEVGIKQGLKIGNWNGYLDLAGFWTEYSNMMEFAFDFYLPEGITFITMDTILKYAGFKAVNIGHAQITGIDFLFTGEGNFLGFPATLLVGYTYTNPVDLVEDSAYKASKSTEDNILKYRYYHSVKADFEVTFGRFITGLSYNYASPIINIDKKFEERVIPEFSNSPYIVPGLKEYREKYNKGYHVLDFRLAFLATENMKFSLIVKNLLNTEYMIRPALIEAPRNVAVQYSITF